MELGVAERKDPAIGTHQPVTLAIGSSRHPDNGVRQSDPARRTVEVGVAEREDRSIGTHQPVTGARLAQSRLPITPGRNRHVGGTGTRLGCPGLALRNRGKPAGQDHYEQNSPQGRERPEPRPAEAL